MIDYPLLLITTLGYEHVSWLILAVTHYSIPGTLISGLGVRVREAIAYKKLKHAEFWLLEGSLPTEQIQTASGPESR